MTRFLLQRETMSTIEATSPNQTEYPLTDEQIANYQRDGFIVLEDVFTGDDLQQIRDAVAQAVESEMHLGNIAARLEGAPMRIWHDQALFKEPRTGVKTPWHQDAVYWPHTERGGQTTIWIALKDATIHNGCMSFVGGTQKLGTMPRID